MILHQVRDALLHRARAFQSRQHIRRHHGAVVGMPIERDLVADDRAALRLGDIVQQDSERDSLGASGGQHRDANPRMRVHVALGMEIFGLLASAHTDDLGQEDLHQAAIHQQVHRARGAALGHHHHDFLADTLGRDIDNRRRCAFHRGPSGGIDREVQTRGEAGSAQDAQMVLLEAVVRISDRADDSGAQIAHPADQIDQSVGDRIVEHPVDREVAADRIFFDRAEAYRRRTASVSVFGIGAEGRDFERLVMVQDNADHAELRADRDRAIEQFLHDFGTRVGGDVVVLGLDAEDSIAHTSAGENGAKAGIDQAMNDLQRLFLSVGHARCDSPAGHFIAARLQGAIWQKRVPLG